MTRLLFFLLLLSAPLRALADGTDYAERLFGFVTAGRGDSLYVRLNPALRSQITADQLGGVFAQLTAQVGAIADRGPWRTDTVMGLVDYRCLVTFERAALDFSVMTDDSLRIVSLTFTMPRPAPEPPKPTQRERALTVTTDSVRLPATLLLPTRTEGRMPVVVFVHGSGPNDRDETLGPNRFFGELADSLAAAGIASLRYDKRTYVYGAATARVSGGRLDYDTEVIDDALSALSLAAAQPEVDAARVFVLGHSLGGALVPLIAARSAVPLAGTIAVAAPARPMSALLREQVDYVGRVTGQSAAATDSLLDRLVATIPPDYLAAADRYDGPAEARRLGGPQLYLGGSHDYQVTRADFDLWQKALRRNRAARFCRLEGLDHLMRRLPAMAVPADYARHEPIAPEAVAAIVDFVATATR